MSALFACFAIFCFPIEATEEEEDSGSSVSVCSASFFLLECNLVEVAIWWGGSQGRRSAPTLGFVTKSLWDTEEGIDSSQRRMQANGMEGNENCSILFS